jgi:hypothetical protein
MGSTDAHKEREQHVVDHVAIIVRSFDVFRDCVNVNIRT